MSNVKNEAGLAKIVIIVAIVAVIAVGVATWLLGAGGLSAEAEQRNTARKADATNLLNAATDFSSKNDNQMPTNYFSGVLAGAPETILSGVETLAFYSSLSISSGGQAAIAADNLVLVTGAKCDAGGATISADAPAMAVQYTQESKDGTLTPQCEDNV